MMKFIRRFKLKIVLLLSGFLCILFLIINLIYMNYYYKQNNVVINSFIGNVLEEVKKKYPDTDEENLIKILNSDDFKSSTFLQLYGIDLKDNNVSKVLENNYNNTIIGSSIILGTLALLLIIIFIIDNLIKNREIRKITDTIRNVNKGNYKLNIIENKEGDFSLLKDELYKTTLMLREKAEASIKDKNILKDSVSNISHQIKTPLTSMLIMIDNLLDQDMDRNLQRDFLKDIRKQIESINFLIISLLKLSRFDANVIEFKKDNINIKKLLFDVSKNVAILAELKDIDIVLSGNSNSFFQGDYKWELEALTNIVKNCIEHSYKEKKIYISFEDNRFFTKIVIEDQGKGINAKDIKHIFERFYKGENSDSNSIGIGLALAKEIIEKDNGSISVRSKEGLGTKFIIKYFK